MFPPSSSMTLPPFTSRELDCVIMEAFMVFFWFVYVRPLIGWLPF
jgi:hypothetical protein